MIHVLIVDDDEDDMNMVVEALEMINVEYRYTWCRNGEQALQQLAFIQPGLILLDYRMTGMNGLQCLEAIRKNPARNGIPVLLHSSLMDRYLEIEGARLGAVACFRKAYTILELVKILEKYVRTGESELSFEIPFNF